MNYTVSDVLIADALVAYALSHIWDGNVVERCADALSDLDYPQSADAIRRYRVLAIEHGVPVKP